MKLNELQINEGVLNVFDRDQKEQYVDIVFNMIHSAYAYAGGIKSNGLDTRAGMIANSPLWKMGKTDGKINSAILYKDKGGRKLVLAATDGSEAGKLRLRDMLSQEFERGYMEVSKDFERYIIKVFPDLVKKYVWPAEKAIAFMKTQGNNVAVMPGKEHHYSRGLSGEIHPKMMLGTVGKSITR